MALPTKYQWLARETAPRILVEALKYYGVREVPGPRNNPTIMQWLKKLLFGWITNDATAWCGTFLAWVATNAGVAVRHPEMPRAFWWENWGNPVAVPMLGDVLVFHISHVGIYVGEDATHYHVLGGNQGDAVSIARFSKTNLRAARRTVWKIAQPPTVRRVWLTPQGVPTNPSTR